jgi:hypothetical protein
MTDVEKQVMDRLSKKEETKRIAITLPVMTISEIKTREASGGGNASNQILTALKRSNYPVPVLTLGGARGRADAARVMGSLVEQGKLKLEDI